MYVLTTVCFAFLPDHFRRAGSLGGAARAGASAGRRGSGGSALEPAACVGSPAPSAGVISREEDIRLVERCSMGSRCEDACCGVLDAVSGRDAVKGMRIRLPSRLEARLLNAMGAPAGSAGSGILSVSGGWPHTCLDGVGARTSVLAAAGEVMADDGSGPPPGAVDSRGVGGVPGIATQAMLLLPVLATSRSGAVPERPAASLARASAAALDVAMRTGRCLLSIEGRWCGGDGTVCERPRFVWLHRST